MLLVNLLLWWTGDSKRCLWTPGRRYNELQGFLSSSCLLCWEKISLTKNCHRSIVCLRLGGSATFASGLGVRIPWSVGETLSVTMSEFECTCSCDWFFSPFYPLSTEAPLSEAIPRFGFHRPLCHLHRQVFKSTNSLRVSQNEDQILIVQGC